MLASFLFLINWINHLCIVGNSGGDLGAAGHCGGRQKAPHCEVHNV